MVIERLTTAAQIQLRSPPALVPLRPHETTLYLTKFVRVVALGPRVPINALQPKTRLPTLFRLRFARVLPVPHFFLSHGRML